MPTFNRVFPITVAQRQGSHEETETEGEDEEDHIWRLPKKTFHPTHHQTHDEDDDNNMGPKSNRGLAATKSTKSKKGPAEKSRSKATASNTTQNNQTQPGKPADETDEEDEDEEGAMLSRTTRSHQPTLGLRLAKEDVKNKLVTSFIPWDPDEWNTIRPCDAIKVTNVINYQMDTDSPTDVHLNINQIGALSFQGRNIACVHLGPWSTAMKNVIIARVLNIDGKHKKHKDALARLGQVRNTCQFKTFDNCEPFSLQYLSTKEGKAYAKALNALPEKPLQRNPQNGKMELFLPPASDLKKYSTEEVMREILKDMEQSIAWSRCYKEPTDPDDDKELNFLGRLLQLKADLFLQLDVCNMALKMRNGRIRLTKKTARRSQSVIHHIPNIDDMSCCVVFDPRMSTSPRKLILCFPIPNIPSEYGSRTIVKSTIDAHNFSPTSVEIHQDEIGVLDDIFGTPSSENEDETEKAADESDEEEEDNEKPQEEEDNGSRSRKDFESDDEERGGGQGRGDVSGESSESDDEQANNTGNGHGQGGRVNNSRNNSQGQSQGQSQGKSKSQGKSSSQHQPQSDATETGGGSGSQLLHQTVTTSTRAATRTRSLLDSVVVEKSQPTRDATPLKRNGKRGITPYIVRNFRDNSPIGDSRHRNRSESRRLQKTPTPPRHPKPSKKSATSRQLLSFNGGDINNEETIFSAFRQSGSCGNGHLIGIDGIDDVIGEASGENGLMDALRSGEVVVEKRMEGVEVGDGNVNAEPLSSYEQDVFDVTQRLLYEGLLEKKMNALEEQKKRLDEAKQIEKTIRLRELLGTDQPRTPTKRTLSAGFSPNTKKRRVHLSKRMIVQV